MSWLYLVECEEKYKKYISALPGNKPEKASYENGWRDAMRFVQSAAPEELGITQNDKRWRILEHGCQWVSWTPTGGETHSFDPRDVKELKRMRAWADETIEKQLAILRDGIASLPSPRGTK